MSSLLRLGSKGDDVVRLQNLLNRHAKPVPPLKLDGDFGPKTEAAVLQFQKQQHLEVDGIVGPQTWNKLNALARNPSGGEHPIGRPVGGGQETAPSTFIEAVVRMALSQDGVMEEPPGSNRGQKVDEYNKTAGVSAGSFWCMSFVYWCFVKASQNTGITNPMPKTAYCPFLYTWARNNGRLAGTPQRGDIFLVRNDGTHTHTGLVTGTDGAGRFTCIEGNTNNDGSANGIGVFKRNRSNGSCDFVRFTTVTMPGKPVAVPTAAASSAVAGGQIAWGKKVPADFKAKVIQISSDLGIDPSHLMACMAFETGETFSPSIKNAAGSGATGLIQFMPSTARGLGTTTDALAGMSAVQQLDYVKKYFQSYKGRLKSLEDVYMAILYPASIGKDPNSTLFAPGTTAYRQNKGLDSNQDGQVTPAEATSKVRAKFNKGMGAGFVG